METRPPLQMQSSPSQLLFSGYSRTRRWPLVRVALAFSVCSAICLYILGGGIVECIERPSILALALTAAFFLFFLVVGTRGPIGLASILLNKNCEYQICTDGVRHRRFMFLRTEFVPWKRVESVDWSGPSRQGDWTLEVRVTLPWRKHEVLELVTEEELTREQRREILGRIRNCRKGLPD